MEEERVIARWRRTESWVLGKEHNDGGVGQAGGTVC